MAPSEELLTTGPAAAHLGVATQTLRSWARAGQVPFVRLPSGRFRFRRSDLDKMIEVTQPAAPDAAA